MRHTLTQVQSIPVLEGKAQAFFDQPGGGVQWMVDERKMPSLQAEFGLNTTRTKWDFDALKAAGYLR